MLIYGRDIVNNVPVVPVSLPRTTTGNGGRDNDLRQKAEWVHAIKEGKPEIAMSNFDYAGMLAETVLLGNVAIRAEGKKLEWDGPACLIKNNSEANTFLKSEYRKGWTL